MKKFIRLMSALLTAMMLLSGLAGLSVIEVSATSKNKGEEETTQDILEKYLTTVYDTPEDKLAKMKLKLEVSGYQLWIDELSGEVATVNLESGQILFSNPYDIATSNGSASTKQQIMSQVVVKYVDNDTEKYFYSFVEAAFRDQIKVKNIKNGVRVEYTLGREETRMLVPRQIRKERFEEVILSVAEAELGADNFTYKKFKAYYLLKDPEAATSDRAKTELYAAFPITKKMAIYVFDPTASETELRKVEEIIKTYCPEYSYEELDKDHEETEYVGSDRAPALFKMALEYTLDDKGMSVRLPANGIRFDESEYKLTYISILPYMGAGANYAGKDSDKTQTGYTMFPDGSGSIFRFEELANKGTTTISGKVYGYDYAYHTLTGSHQETIRYPAFGIVANDITTELVKNETDGKLVEQEVTVDRGYLAVIEEGDALAEIYTYHAGTLSKYNTIQMMFYPRPRDTYNMKDSISVGTNTPWTVVSKRKYVGNYKIRYFMLTDENIAKEKDILNYYETSWMGMATALRNYFDEIGMLERLTTTEVKEDIPLYIETFGAIQTVEKILSIPVNTMVPLTSFEDIMTMYDDLAKDGITNVDFKLTGYANGGMYSSVPYKLSWESAVGGKSGFKDLLAYAEEKDFGVYPDFDFVYAQGGSTKAFDGLTYKKHLVKTIDNRYSSKREYSATYQTFVGYYDLALSPAYFSHFYEKLTKNYKKYGATNISVSTLGSDLNSDFDEDEPYNREDSKGFTVEALKYLDENFDSVMVSGGNAYTWKYVDHILNVSLDSSRYNKSSNSVPFIGVVLHGYVQFAGSPLNMEGNIGYAKLRTIENGASPYFILSYQNTTLLKDDFRLSQYYSVRYDIWYDELVSIYNELNSVLADVQTKLIIDHQFLVGERVPDADELEADIREAMKDLEASLTKAEADATIQAVKDILNARLTTKNNAAKIAELLETTKAAADTAKASIAAIEAALLAIPEAQAAVTTATEAADKALEAYTAAQQATKDAKAAYDAVRVGTDATAITTAKAAYDAASAAEKTAKAASTEAQTALKTAQSNVTAADKALETALSTGTTACDTADKAAEQAAIMAKDARTAAEFVNKVASATDAIKKAALDYAESAEKDSAQAQEYAKKANDNAAVAKAISADRTVASLISTAETAANSATAKAADVTTRYESVLKAKTNYEEAAKAEADALKVYEDAKAAYATALAAAALSTATEADKTAAAEAGTIMNTAKADYTTASSASAKLENSYNSAITALRNALQKVLDAKNNALTAAQTTADAVQAAKEAVASLKTLEGISETLTNAAIKSSDEAAVSAVGVNAFVDAAKATYEAAAELVKEYVVIVEEPEIVEEPVVETPVTEDPTTDDTGDGTTTETPAVEDETGNQLYSNYEYTKYTNDNGNIVKVVYGEPDVLGGYTAYKTFILNYNYFDVTVVVDNITYTIPASGYVVFYQ